VAISVAVALTLSMFPFLAIVAIVVLLIYEKYNLIAGILLFVIIAFGGFIIFPGLAVIMYGDIYYTIGGFAGLILTFRNRKLNQTPYKTSITVSLIGVSISSFLISIHQGVMYMILFGFDIMIFGVNIVVFMPFAIVLGLIIGFIYGYIKKKQEEDEED
jgi:hypothetical protein